MRLKEEHLALSSGIGLAGFAISHFWDEGKNAIELYKEEIIESIVKPTKMTAVHHYLANFQDVYEELDGFRKAGMDNEYTYLFIEKTLDNLGMKPNLPEPDFENCSGDAEGYHDEKCQCGQELEKWKKYINDNCRKIDELIIHSAFQIVFRDRVFLHDFHLLLSEYVGEWIDDIKGAHPDCVTSKDRIKRRTLKVDIAIVKVYEEREKFLHFSEYIKDILVLIELKFIPIKHNNNLNQMLLQEDFRKFDIDMFKLMDYGKLYEEALLIGAFIHEYYYNHKDGMCRLFDISQFFEKNILERVKELNEFQELFKKASRCTKKVLSIKRRISWKISL